MLGGASGGGGGSGGRVTSNLAGMGTQSSHNSPEGSVLGVGSPGLLGTARVASHTGVGAAGGLSSLGGTPPVALVAGGRGSSPPSGVLPGAYAGALAYPALTSGSSGGNFSGSGNYSGGGFASLVGGVGPLGSGLRLHLGLPESLPASPSISPRAQLMMTLRAPDTAER